MFGDVTLKDIDKQRITIYGVAMLDVIKVLTIVEKQSKEIEELKEKDDANLAYYDQIYQNGIYTGQKAVEDKIKAKIEAIKTNKLRYFHIAPENWVINILQSLLEKE